MFSEMYVDCTNPNNKYSTDLPKITFLSEEFGPDSKCFLSNDNRPVCLRVRCDEVRNVIEVLIGPFVFICSEEGQSHALPETDRSFQCPSFAAICPRSICPSNCAGNGVCNREKKKCECFDSLDTSPGCTASNPMVTTRSSSSPLFQSFFSPPLLLASSIVTTLIHFL
jgi:hypothetical protein